MTSRSIFYFGTIEYFLFQDQAEKAMTTAKKERSRAEEAQEDLAAMSGEVRRACHMKGWGVGMGGGIGCDVRRAVYPSTLISTLPLLYPQPDLNLDSMSS